MSKTVYQQSNASFLIAIILNALFVIFQLLFSYLAHSTSLLADAVHNLGDVLSLLVAWTASALAKRPPTHRSTYGLKKGTVLAALLNAVVLVFSCGIIVTEASYKLFSPTETKALTVIVVAALGILVNGGTAVLFYRGTQDLNIRAAFLHLIYDALISLGVVIAGLIIYFTHWFWVDPIMGLLIAFFIMSGTWSLLKDSLRLIIDAVPKGISFEVIRNFLLTNPRIVDVHDLHIWALSTKENALSAHIYMPVQPLTDEERQQLVFKLQEIYHIHHVTLQIEQKLDFCKDACILKL